MVPVLLGVQLVEPRECRVELGLAQGRRLLWFNRAMAAVLVLTAWWMISV